jgi:Flp pilus assembly protein TadD
MPREIYVNKAGVSRSPKSLYSATAWLTLSKNSCSGDTCPTGDFESRSLSASCQAIELDPAASAAQYNLGMALARTGREGQAVVEFRMSVNLDPTRWPPGRRDESK